MLSGPGANPTPGPLAFNSPWCVEKPSKKSLGSLSSVGIAGILQRNEPRSPRLSGFWGLGFGTGQTFWTVSYVQFSEVGLALAAFSKGPSVPKCF
jgi:hypothetical protein